MDNKRKTGSADAGQKNLIEALRQTVYREAVEQYASFCRSLIGSEDSAHILDMSEQKTVKEQIVSMLDPDGVKLDEKVVAWCYEQGDNLLDALYSRCRKPDACLRSYLSDVFAGIKAEMFCRMEETA